MSHGIRTVPDRGPGPGGRRARAALARGGAASALALLLWLPAGCGSDADFDRAARSNTAAAWDDYLRVHPDGQHAREARARLAALLENQEWQRAQAAGSADSYQRYLRSYPQGAHAHDALVAIAGLNLARAPAGAMSAGPAPSPSPAGAPEPAAPEPAPAPASRVPPPVAAVAPPQGPPAATAGAFRVQLGSFAGGSAAAERAWRELSARHPQLAGRTPLITPSRSTDGRTLTRLQLEGFDRAGAEALCRALVERNDPCVTVAPLEPPAAPSR